MYAAIASFVGAAGMLVLSLLGFRHLRRVPVEEEVGLGSRHSAAKPAIA
jgi:hypothetical protein